MPACLIILEFLYTCSINSSCSINDFYDYVLRRAYLIPLVYSIPEYWRTVNSYATQNFFEIPPFFYTPFLAFMRRYPKKIDTLTDGPQRWLTGAIGVSKSIMGHHGTLPPLSWDIAPC